MHRPPHPSASDIVRGARPGGRSGCSWRWRRAGLGVNGEPRAGVCRLPSNAVRPASGSRKRHFALGFRRLNERCYSGHSNSGHLDSRNRNRTNRNGCSSTCRCRNRRPTRSGRNGPRTNTCHCPGNRSPSRSPRNDHGCTCLQYSRNPSRSPRSARSRTCHDPGNGNQSCSYRIDRSSIDRSRRTASPCCSSRGRSRLLALRSRVGLQAWPTLRR